MPLVLVPMIPVVLQSLPLPSPDSALGGRTDGAILFGWVGYGLLCCVVLAVWVSRQWFLLRRRRWIQRAGEAFDRGGFRELHRLFHHTEFKRAVGDLTGILRRCEALLVAEREANDELRGELEEARRCFEALPLAGIILDGDGYLLAATPDACRLFDRTEQALVGERLERFVRGDLTGPFPRRVQVAAPGGVLREMDLFLRSVGLSPTDHRMGLLVDVSRGTPRGEPSDGAAATPRSVQAMEAMGELAGSVAHDFNDQLTTILGHSYLLLGLAEEESGDRENIEEIARAAEQARLLTQQLLAFSRRQAVRPETLDVVAFLRGMDRDLGAILGPGAELEIRCEEEAASVRIDPVQLRAAVEHLVRNAHEAMGDGGRLLIGVAVTGALPGDVRGPAVEAGCAERWVRLSFVDSGPGMDPDTLSRAFEPYFTSHQAEGRRGMGLPSVYGIVTQAGGRVAMAHAADRGFGEGGMVMEIHLPLAPGGRPVEITTSPTAAVSRERKRVCVVEDDPQVRRLVSFILNRDGFDVVTAENGREALRICEERAGDIDLVLTDVNMPYVGGLELAEEVRRRLPNTKTIFMSGFMESDGIRVDARAPTSFLQKPFTPRELLDHVHRGVARMETVGETATRVLVIDDEDAVRETMCALLEGLGYECQTARDGEEALWMLRSREADIVISDMVMPNKDGIQTCIEIQRLFPDARIIAMSGKLGGGSSLAAAERLGAVATLTKPFSRDELRLALEKARE